MKARARPTPRLQIALDDGIEDADQGAQRAKQHDDPAPPPDGAADEIEEHAQKRVDRDLGHDAAHQRRDVARRGRMGERQPGVQGHEPGLGAGAEHGERDDDRGRQRGRCGLPDCREAVAAAEAGKDTECEER